MAEIFTILGEPTRLRIILHLQEVQEDSVGEMAEALELSQSNLSHQLAILKRTDLVKFRKEGRKTLYSLDDEHVEELIKVAFIHAKHQ